MLQASMILGSDRTCYYRSEFVISKRSGGFLLLPCADGDRSL
ncbi:hypothetical protein [Chlorogloeopsis fritschii]|nr:hypothetical protein [Chlorogloeopsis fritschii]